MIPQLAELLSQPLMMDVDHVTRLCGIESMSEVAKSTRNDVEMSVKEQASAKSGSNIIAVLPVRGFIDAKSSEFLDWIGGTSLESLIGGIDLCLNEPRVSGIVFDYDTGGGSAYGVKVAADYIYENRNRKPMVSVVRYAMCSAGYYLGSAASRIIAEPTSITGSIGVVMAHYDETKLLDRIGIKTTVMRIPEYKQEGRSDEPLTDAAKTNMESRIADLYDDFTKDVGRYRGIDQAAVKENYGKGRCLSHKEALSCGMVDRVSTFHAVINDMASGTMKRSLAHSNRMEGDVDTAVLANKLQLARM